MLNPSQEKAVEHKEGTAIVLAGAGSGKTKILTNRIAKLIWDGSAPSSIFATTFTKKAATEIRERASKLTNGASDSTWLGTFHSLAIRILREYLEGETSFPETKADLNWEKSFLIYDENDSRSIFYEIGRNKGWEKEDIFNFRKIVSVMRNDGFGIIQTQNQYPPECISLFWESLSEFSRNNSLGYDEILWVCLLLVKEEPALQVLLQCKFQHILIDECQDMNSIQHHLVQSIFFGEDLPEEHDYSGQNLYGKYQPRSLFLVGDIDQAIYSWRGAKPELIVSFPEKFNATIYRVEENYRSIPSIVETANRLILNNKSRLDKKLIPTREYQKSKISWFWALDNNVEASKIAQNIKNLKEQEIKLNEIAILYRTKQQSRIIEQALAKNEIPYKVLDGLKFFDRKEVKDLLYYLRISVNPEDTVALEHSINTPRRGIGGTTIAKLKKLAELRKISLWKILQDPFSWNSLVKGKTLIALKNYVALVSGLQGIALSKDLVGDLCSKTGYDKYLASIDDTEEREARINNLSELQSTIDDYLTANPNGSNKMINFLESIILDSEKEKEENRNCPSVSLLTIHSAKGLEFPIVFLSGLEDNTLPHFRSTTPQEIEEERRLCYVAVTRAKDMLFMSGSSIRNGYHYHPSRFVEEMRRK